MRRIGANLLVLLLVVLTAAPVLCAAEPSTTQPTSPASPASVLVFSRGIGGTSCGNGFAIGDGTLIVTARHVVFPQRLLGQHQGDAFVTVLSPYLGDACEADVVAQDRELDVVVLRGPWQGHPALRLAEEEEVVAAERVKLTGFIDALSAVTAGQPRLLDGSGGGAAAQDAALGVDVVTVRRSATRRILTESAPPGPGWAGAPMLLPAIGNVAGCFCRTQADGSTGAGTTAGVIRSLVTQAGLGAALGSAPQPRATQPDAAAAAALYLRGIASSAAHDPSTSFDQLQSFLKLRPQSAVGYRDAAGQARALDRKDVAQDLYAKSLQLAPDLVSARVLYGQLLDERIMPTHALEQLRYAWEHGRGSTAAAIPMCNILRQQKQEAQCLQLLTEAVKRSPLDSYLWNYLGQSRAAQHDTAGAAEAFARSAELMPENEPVCVQAAEAYEAAGNAVKAEQQYRTLVRTHPESGSAHFLLARFLARDASSQAESLREAQQALDLSGRPGSPSRSEIQDLIIAVRSGQRSSKGAFSLQ